jgi:hypothetical protein
MPKHPPRTRPLTRAEKKAVKDEYRAINNNIGWVKWNARNPGKHREMCRRNDSIRKYGITLEEAEQILKDQGGKCAICKKETTFGGVKGAHKDHDHVTNEFRCILCQKCNIGLGAFYDDTTSLLNAINYLKKKRFILVHNSFVKAG